jgi:hypothetical protein
MDSTDTILLVAFGLGIGVVVGYFIFRPRQATTQYSVVQGYQPTIASVSPLNEKIKYQNEEVWSWTDWKGRPREIVVHRKVKENV